MRMFLYETLLAFCGPHKAWKEQDQCKFLLPSLAKYFSWKSGKTITARAVGLQIRWAITEQQRVEDSHMVQFIENRSAAYEVGFIDNLPRGTWNRQSPKDAGARIEREDSDRWECKLRPAHAATDRTG